MFSGSSGAAQLSCPCLVCRETALCRIEASWKGVFCISWWMVHDAGEGRCGQAKGLKERGHLQSFPHPEPYSRVSQGPAQPGSKEWQWLPVQKAFISVCHKVCSAFWCCDSLLKDFSEFPQLC